jgi:hypothetical protein
LSAYPAHFPPIHYNIQPDLFNSVNNGSEAFIDLMAALAIAVMEITISDKITVTPKTVLIIL